MSIFVARAFLRLREIVTSNKELATRIEKLGLGHDHTASVIEVLVEDIDRLAVEVKHMKAFRLCPNAESDSDRKTTISGQSRPTPSPQGPRCQPGVRRPARAPDNIF